MTAPNIYIRVVQLSDQQLVEQSENLKFNIKQQITTKWELDVSNPSDQQVLNLI